MMDSKYDSNEAFEGEELNKGLESDILEYLLIDEKNRPLDPNYFENAQMGKIKTIMREQLIVWMIELCNDKMFSHSTKEIAINCVDMFLSSAALDMNLLQLLGITAILVATKQQEKDIYPITDALFHSGNQYTFSQMKDMEVKLLSVLSWRIQYPTASEIARVLLYLVFPNYNTECLNYLDIFMDLILCSHESLNFLPSSMAVACIYIYLEENDTNLRDVFAEKVSSSNMFDEDETLKCIQLLRGILSQKQQEGIQQSLDEGQLSQSFDTNSNTPKFSKSSTMEEPSTMNSTPMTIETKEDREKQFEGNIKEFLLEDQKGEVMKYNKSISFGIVENIMESEEDLLSKFKV